MNFSDDNILLPTVFYRCVAMSLETLLGSRLLAGPMKHVEHTEMFPWKVYSLQRRETLSHRRGGRAILIRHEH